MASVFFDGLMTGLDTTSIIRQLMSAEAAPKVRLEQRMATYDKRVTAWGSVSTNLSALRKSANDLLTPQKLNLFSATSSDTAIATASASSAAAPGSFSFRVTQLATSHQLMSAGFASASNLVGAGTFTVDQGTAKLGFTSVTAGSALATGGHEIEVIAGNAASSATYTGGAVTSLDFTNQRRIDLTVNGVARSVNIAAGVYTSVDQLAAAVQTAIGNDVQVTNVNGALRINTTATGPTSSIQITGGAGSALTKLGWSIMGAPTAGTAAGGTIIELDGVQNTVVWSAGQQATLTGANGPLTVTMGAGPTAGTAKVFTAQTDGTTTLAGLASKLTAAGLSAQAIDTGDGTATPYHLVLSAAGTGTANQLTVNSGGLAAFAGGFTTLRAAADAKLTLGDGGLTITRGSNTITDVLPGVTLQLTKADPTKDVTVTVDHDADAIVDKVKGFITALNTATGGLRSHTKAGQLSKTGELEANASAGILWGDGNARRLQQLLANGMWYSGSGDLSRASQIGIEVERDGTYTLDEQKLRDQLAEDFDGVVELLTKDTTTNRQGLFGTMSSIIDAALATDGIVDSATKAAQRQSDDAEDRIAAFDVRLSLIETRYRRQFAAMETVIGQLKNQSSWLAGQIAQLPSAQ